jgi:hypothetical protein
MKTLTLTATPSEVSSLLDQAESEDVLVQLQDGREFLVVAVDDFGSEVARTRCNQELMRLLDERGQQPATIPLADVKRRLGLS